MNKLELNGSTKEQATQLFELIKDQKISAQELDNLVPTYFDFFKEFGSVIKEYIKSESEAFKMTTSLYETIIKTIEKELTRKELTDQQRKQIIDVIYKLSNDIRDIATNKQNKDFYTKISFGVIILTIIGGIFYFTRKKDNQI